MGKCLSQIKPNKVSPINDRRSPSPAHDAEDNKRTEADEFDEDDQVSNAEQLMDAETMFNSKKRVVVKNTKPIASLYQIGKVIGMGNLGEIRKALHVPTGEHRAIKIFSKQLCTKDHLKRIYYEIELMKTFDHPGIVKIYEWLEDN